LLFRPGSFSSTAPTLKGLFTGTALYPLLLVLTLVLLLLAVAAAHTAAELLLLCAAVVLNVPLPLPLLLHGSWLHMLLLQEARRGAR
jgi:hypothetical protein